MSDGVNKQRTDFEDRPARRASVRHSAHDEQPAYVLHAYPFKETSLVVEVFTRNFGRLGLVARGARRPHSAVRGLLLAFQPLTLAWGGKSELRTLHKAEASAVYGQLAGLSLMCGFYLNELVLKLLPREDAHEELYGAYEDALLALRTDAPQARTLRRFEKCLLRELGYGLMLDRDIHGVPIRADARYTYVLEAGPRSLDEAGVMANVDIAGTTLLDLATDDYRNATTLYESRALMRYVLNHYLGGYELHTRQLLRDMQQL